MAMTGLTDLGAVSLTDAGDTSNLLVVILDLNPVWWADHSQNPVETSGDKNGHGSSSNAVSLVSVLDQVMVFLNAYLLLHPTNQLLVLGCLNSKSYSLFPPEQKLLSQPKSDSRPDQFHSVNHSIQWEVRRRLLKAMEEMNSGADESRETVFIGALSRAICYIHRIQREAPKGHSVKGRILIIETGHDSSSHYMHFINTAFTAQKMNVKIDACVLGENSTLLQQAVDLTDGIYLKVDHLAGLIQILNSVFLLEPSERSKFVIPEKVIVDYRAACFCHQKLIEVGFVCSVCLSVFCTFSPLCSTCQSTFKFMTGIKKRKPLDNVSMPSTSGSQLKKPRTNGSDMNGR